MLGMAIWCARTGPYRPSTITTVATTSSSREIPTWVSDLAWLDYSPYDSSRGPAPSVWNSAEQPSALPPYLQKTTVSVANDTSKLVFTDSESLHWSEGYYRAYFELYITPEQVGAQFFGMPTSKERNAGEISWLTELLRAATIVWSGTRIMWPLVEW